MARSFPADFSVLSPLEFTTSRAVREGSDGTHEGELDLAENINWLYAHHWSPVAAWFPIQAQPFTTTATSPTIYAVWRRETPTDCGDYEVKVRCEITGSTDQGKIRFEMATGAGPGDAAGGSSDSSEGVTITLNAGSGKQTATANWTPDVSETVDTIELHAWVTGTTDTLKIYSVEIYPQELSSPLASGVTTGGFVPFDTTEIAADEPLATVWRKIARDNLEVIRKGRTTTIVSYSDDAASSGTAQFASSSARTDYETVMRCPFRSPFGASAVRWAFHAFVSAGTGTVKIENVKNGSSVEVSVTGTSWTSPYDAGMDFDWNSNGGALTVGENVNEELRVSIKADSTNVCKLMSFTAWVAEV